MDEKIESTEKQLGGCTGKGFLPGQCGNPAGHPKGQPNMKQRFLAALEKYSQLPAPPAMVKKLREQIPGLPDGLTIGELEGMVVHAHAIKGQSWAYDRLHGKPDQRHDINMGASIVQSTQDITKLSAEEQAVIRAAIKKTAQNDGAESGANQQP
jgi:hypothetical protein